MDTSFVGWFLHIDSHLSQFFQLYGVWAYAIVFLIIFGETGFVFLPFLPGDSLLFATGALAAGNGPDLVILLVLISAASILGNTVNFFIGRGVGLAATGEHFLHRLIKPKHLESAHAFFAKWGGWAVTLCRFVPIVRTVTPFVAGIGKMGIGAFTVYNVIGSVAWTFFFILLGYFFGNLPFVKDHFFILVLIVLIVSIVPFIIALVKSRMDRKQQDA